MHVIPLSESQFWDISYEHTHAPSVLVSCEYYDSFDHDVDSRPVLGTTQIKGIGHI